MKVIFLDHDGVICLHDNWGTRLKKQKEWGNVSSDWKRWATVEEMGQYYESQGIIKKPIAFTDSILYDSYEDFPWQRNLDSEQTRSLEISQYLGQNSHITHWVAIDDLDMSLREGEKSWGLKNFVLTPMMLEGIKQSGKKEKIIKYLS